MDEDLKSLVKFSIAFVLLSYVAMFLFYSTPFLSSDYYISSLNTHFNEPAHIITEDITFHVNQEKFHELFKDYYGSPDDVVSLSCPVGFTSSERDTDQGYELNCRSPTIIKQGDYKIHITYSPKRLDWKKIKWVSFNNVPRKVKSFTSNGDVAYKSSFNGEPLVAYYPSESSSDKIYVQFIRFTYYLGLIIPILFVILFFIIYYLFGKEHNVEGVPNVYHSPPNENRYAFDVALAFIDPPTSSGIKDKIKPVISSILIEAAVRGIIKITDKKVIITDDKKNGNMSKLPVDIQSVIKKMASIQDVKSIDYSDYKGILNNIKDYFDTELNNNGKVYDDKGEQKFELVLFAIMIISGFMFFIPVYELFALASTSLGNTNIFVFIETMISLFLMGVLGKHIFGRYKTRETYKEKLLWDAFGRLLKNESLLKKYGPKDKNMWGRWLSYAYAFGVPKKIINNIIKENEMNTYVSTAYMAYMGASFTSISNRSSGGSSFDGGGFGGGFSGGGSFGAR